MKKLSIVLCLLLISFAGFSQAASKLSNYVGKYSITDGALHEVSVSIKDGKLFGSSEQGEAPLTQIGTSDNFEIEGYGGSVKFAREKGIVKAMTMTVQGQEMNGTRNLPAMADYVGNFIFEGAPFATMLVTADEATIYGDVEGVGKSALDNTSNLDEFTEPNYNSIITFKRNDAGSVVSVVIVAQGSEMIGKKEN